MRCHTKRKGVLKPEHGATDLFDEPPLPRVIRFVQAVMAEENRARARREEPFEIACHHAPGRIAEPPQQRPFAAIGHHG